MAQFAGELRYDNANLHPLEDSDIKKLCPAAFAAEPRSDVSSRYGFVSTVDLIHAMRDAGFAVTQVNSYRRRDEDAKRYTKHLIRFRKQGEISKLKRGDVIPQIVLVNSHDRSSQFHLYGGLWRMICENGLMVSESSTVQPVVVRHTTNAITGLMEATTQLVKQQKFVFEHVDAMRETILSDRQARLFAERALALRPERAGAIDSAQLLQVRREEDAGLDVWHVYNRAQENLMRGGLKGVTSSNHAVVTRGITSVNADLQVNRGLWSLAVEAIAKAAQATAKAQASSGATVRKAAKKATATTAE